MKKNRNEKEPRAFVIFKDTIIRYNLINSGECIIVGFSGGPDSVALLYALHNLKKDLSIKLTAVHVNHNLRGEESKRDEEFCKDFCRSLDIPINIYSADIKKIAKDNKLTLEEAGRMFRYDAFYKTLRDIEADKIAVAHNKNDNAETILMRLSRGTGLKGLSGIPVRRDEIIRPMLFVDRDSIIKYCSDNNLPYCIDSTNDNDSFMRNKFRIWLIPFLEKNVNSSVVNTISNMAENLGEENDFLDKIAEAALDKCLVTQKKETECWLLIEKLSGIDKVIAKRVIRLAYIRVSGDAKDIARIHVDAVYSLLNKKTGKIIELPGNIVVENLYGMLALKKNNDHSLEIQPFCYTIEYDKSIYIKERNISVKCEGSDKQKVLKKMYTITIYYDKIKPRLQVRSRKPGDKIYLENVGSKKIKDFLSSLKIEKTLRDELFYIADNDNIVAVLSKNRVLRVSGSYKLAHDTSVHAGKNSITISVMEGKGPWVKKLLP